eukprot:COSAG01_NODE_6220_length_3784_cov_1.767707_5_plen_242_part_00
MVIGSRITSDLIHCGCALGLPACWVCVVVQAALRTHPAASVASASERWERVSRDLQWLPPCTAAEAKAYFKLVKAHLKAHKEAAAAAATASSSSTPSGDANHAAAEKHIDTTDDAIAQRGRSHAHSIQLRGVQLRGVGALRPVTIGARPPLPTPQLLGGWYYLFICLHPAALAASISALMLSTTIPLARPNADADLSLLSAPAPQHWLPIARAVDRASARTHSQQSDRSTSAAASARSRSR